MHPEKYLKRYLVGGAVRDSLLGVDVQDRDYVVVNANASELLSLGFEQVGMGFPVFLHPVTREEHALARREKKVGSGYTGFEFETGLDVTLVEDLERRDFTMNSMALDDDGSLIDPFGGEADLMKKVIRHTSAAFAEDPLRVVRLARFYARYAHLGFTVAPETMTLASQMVERGDLNELPHERFWLELEKAFKDPEPEKFFVLLFEIGAFNSVSFFQRLFGWFTGRRLEPVMKMARAARKLNDPELAVDVFAAWVSPSDTTNFLHTGRCGHLFTLLQEVSRLGSRPDAIDVLRLLTLARAWGDPSRANDLIRALEVFEDAHGKASLPSTMLKRALQEGRSVTSAAYQHLEGPAIGRAMAQERANRIAAVL